jgi:hypothetical protein
MEIQNHPNYLIYPDGKVFSKRSNIVLKHMLNNEGYYSVDLPSKKNMLVHRLIAIHYIPNPENKDFVDHINRNRKDNLIENLRWATRSENNTNIGMKSNNKSGFKWISYDTYSNQWRFSRKLCKVKKSISLNKLLCYSFFYLIKL